MQYPGQEQKPETPNYLRPGIAFIMGGLVMFLLFELRIVGVKKLQEGQTDFQNKEIGKELQLVFERTIVGKRTGPEGVTRGDTLQFMIPINQLPDGINSYEIESALTAKNRAMQEYKAMIK